MRDHLDGVRPDTLETGRQYLLLDRQGDSPGDSPGNSRSDSPGYRRCNNRGNSRQCGGYTQVWTPVRFASYTPCPAIVIITDERGEKQRCAREDLFSLPVPDRI